MDSRLNHPSLDRTMVFTPDRSVLYVAVPKTGCTTVKTVMAAAAGLVDPNAERFGARLGDIHGRLKRRREFWSTLGQDAREAMVTGAATFRFTSVRDPFERIVSCYLSKVAREHSPHPLRQHLLDRGDTSLAAFLRFVREQPLMRRDVHCRRQVDLCFPGDIAYDMTIRYETFEADLGRVIERLAVPGLKIPRLDPTKPTEAKALKGSLLGEDEKALVREIYAADFAAFGYSPS